MELGVKATEDNTDEKAKKDETPAPMVNRSLYSLFLGKNKISNFCACNFPNLFTN